MEYIEKLKILTNNLEKCERVTKHSTRAENQADTLANSLIDIENAVQQISKKIPELYRGDLDTEDIDDLILEIGEELRHILYHLNDTRVYAYLRPEGD